MISVALAALQLNGAKFQTGTALNSRPEWANRGTRKHGHPQGSQIGHTGHKFGLSRHFKRKPKVFHTGR